MTPAEAVDRIVVIGMLPESPIRTRLMKAYDEFQSYARLLPADCDNQLELSVQDVELLTLKERAFFLKGAALILKPRLRERPCICKPDACVFLPVVAFTSILREDVELARKSWKTFARIPRSCAEKFPQITRLLNDEESPNADKKVDSLDLFIAELVGNAEHQRADQGAAIRAAEEIEKEYRINRPIRPPELDPEEGN